MKIEIPQIYWHGDRDRIMSIDFYPNTNILVTCGAEVENKMWVKVNFNINLSSGKSKIQTTLNRDQKANTATT
jgi:hypothetical protein